MTVPRWSRRLAATIAIGVAAVAVGLPAGPALAAGSGADLGIRLTGTTITAGTPGSFLTIVVTNAGPDRPLGGHVTFDVSALDQTKVTLGPQSDCVTAGTLVTCDLGAGLIPVPGGSTEALFPLVVASGASGAAGTLTATVSSDSPDADPANDTASAPVTIGGDGVNLVVQSPDVVDIVGGEERPVAPGAGGTLFVDLFNQGNRAAVGLSVTVTVPPHTRFAANPGCAVEPDGHQAVCTYDAVTLQPFAVDPNHAVILFAYRITVDADAPGPAVLSGGVSEAAATGSADPTPDTASALPAGASWQARTRLDDADPTDNRDEFAVRVGAPPGAGLPVTGIPLGRYVAIGATAVVLGVLLVLIGRRRGDGGRMDQDGEPDGRATPTAPGD